MTKKILVTGVAGFIGSNIASRLVEMGYEVFGVDNLSNGFERNIETLRGNKNFTFLKADIRDAEILSGNFSKLDYILHLAAYKIPRYSDSLDTLMINTHGTENILELARKIEAKVVFSSTSDIYGKNPSLPFKEDSNIVLGQTNVRRWAYAVSKIFDEHLCFAYHERYNLPVSIVRYFGGYGPHQNLTWWGGPQSVFIDCALSNNEMPIHGDGLQTRTFTYVDDMVSGTIKIMESERSAGEVFNIGAKREIAIIDLARMIWKMIRPKEEPKIKKIPYKDISGKYEDVMRRVPDVSKAEEMLGFNAEIQLEEGLPKTIQWQRDILKRAK
jgi:UDP-glucose 4-epimerase